MITPTRSRTASFSAAAAIILLMAVVFREPVVRAAAELLDVRITNLDANGYVAVHEQGTAKVRVTNPSLFVQPQAAAPWHGVAHLGDYNGGNSGFQGLSAPHPGPIALTSLTISYLYGAGFIQIVTSDSCQPRTSPNKTVWQMNFYNVDPQKTDTVVVTFPTPLQSPPPSANGGDQCLGAFFQGTTQVWFTVSASGFYVK